jgi:MFS family permease
MNMNGDAVVDRKAGTAQGVVLILASLLPVMAIVSLVPVIPLLFRQFDGVDGAGYLIPMALSIPALCIAVFSPLAGSLSDRLGRRKLLVGTLFVYAAFGMAPLFLTDLKAIIATRIGVGIAEAVIMTVATTLLGDYFQGEARNKWIAIQTGGIAVGATVLIFVGGLLGEFGWRGPFLLYALALILLAAVMVLLYEPNRQIRTVKESTDGDRLPRGVILVISVLTLCASVLFYSYLQLGTVLASAGVSSPTLIGLAGAIGNLAVACGSVGFKYLRKCESGKILSGGFGLVAIGLVGLASAQSFATIVAATFAVMLGSGLLLPTLIGWTMNVVPPALRGRGMGIWTGCFFFGQFLSPVLIGVLNSPMGGIGASLRLLGGVAVLCALLSVMLARLHPPIAARVPVL